MNTKVVNPKVVTIPPLLPCPFCARKDLDVIKFNNNKYAIVCSCGCESPHDSTSIPAVQRVWNRRRYRPQKEKQIKLTKQRRWQIKMVSERRCQICGNLSTTKYYCATHTKHNNRLQKNLYRKAHGIALDLPQQEKT